MTQMQTVAMAGTVRGSRLMQIPSRVNSGSEVGSDVKSEKEEKGEIQHGQESDCLALSLCGKCSIAAWARNGQWKAHLREVPYCTSLQAASDAAGLHRLARWVGR